MRTTMLKQQATARFGLAHAIALACVSIYLVGCGSGYAIEGRVVRGSIAMIEVVDDDDPRMTDPDPSGGGATIEGLLEPDTPTEREALGKHTSNGQGYFSIPVNAMGAGFLEYEARLIARRPGHQGAMQTIDLPRRGQAVLITLPAGRDTLVVPENYLERTLRDAEPYLRDDR